MTALDVVEGADFGRARHKRRAANICQGICLFALGEPTRNLACGVFAHAVDEQVGLRVKNERAADLIVPVVVVRKAAQACLQSADDDGDIAEGLAAAVGVHDGRAVGRRPIRLPGE